MDLRRAFAAFLQVTCFIKARLGHGTSLMPSRTHGCTAVVACCPCLQRPGCIYMRWFSACHVEATERGVLVYRHNHRPLPACQSWRRLTPARRRSKHRCFQGQSHQGATHPRRSVPGTKGTRALWMPPLRGRCFTRGTAGTHEYRDLGSRDFV
ncbi:hypothetical protein B0T22DRAFT_448541 [Podospora appendiculata]|uniref:Uncharacterized protein n=1 Tax=Podospora appendiculata TaxID=314037 RepID=A0AAE1CFW6_9PEZI|nr:hypothetical protein B0T22DRAFT_448541 [Podospora appendiculata]